MRGQKTFKINEKGSQLDRKLRANWNKSALNLLNNTLWRKIRPTLGPSISGTKCNRDKQIFSAERGGQSDCVEV